MKRLLTKSLIKWKKDVVAGSKIQPGETLIILDEILNVLS